MVRLEPAPDAATPPAPSRRVYAAVVQLIRQTWKDLGFRGSDDALDWIAYGGDSLLSVAGPVGDSGDEPATHLAFWFYEDAEWPQELAAHWLRLALALRRDALVEELARMGYRLDPGELPTVDGVLHEPEARYFLNNDLARPRLGRASRDTIAWVYGRTAPSSMPYAELSLRGRAVVDDVLASGCCACPACAEVVDRPASSLDATGAGAYALRSVETLAREVEHVIRRPDGELAFAFRGMGLWDYTAGFVVSDLVAPSRRLSQLDLHWVARDRDGAWVACPDRHDGAIRVSLDDGATWSRAGMTGSKLPAAARFFASRVASSDVIAAGMKQKAVRLWCSTTGGRSWRLLGALPPVVRTAAEVTDVLRLDDTDQTWLVWVTSHGLFRTDDGARTWEHVELPVALAGRGLVSSGSAVGCHGTADGDAVMLRSSDAGRSWSIVFRRPTIVGTPTWAAAFPGGRWFVSLIGEPGTYTSTDDGLTFAPCARPTTTRFLGPADDGGWLLQARRHLLLLRERED